MSLGAPLGIDIGANTQPAEAGLDRVGKKLDQVKTKAREAALATRDLNKEMGNQLRAGAIAARGTAGAGAFSGIAGGVQAGGATGTLAAAIAAAAAAVNVIGHLNKKAIETGDRLADAAAFNEKKNEHIQAESERSALRGFSQAEAYRKTFAIAGPRGIRTATELMDNGVEPQSAYEAAGNLRAIDDNQMPAAIQLLLRARKLGGDIGNGSQILGNRPWMINDPTAIAHVAGLPRDAYMDPTRTESFAKIDKFLIEAERIEKQLGTIPVNDRERFANGLAGPFAMKAAQESLNPGSTLKNPVLEKLDQLIVTLQVKSKAQAAGDENLGKFDKLIGSLDRFTNQFAPGGNFETQITRAMRDKDRIISGDP